jgi:hypothetical protein
MDHRLSNFLSLITRKSTSSDLMIYGVCRNELEAYLFRMKSKVEGDLAGKLGEDEEKVEKALKEGLEWLEENPHADALAHKDKQHEIHDTVRPILAVHEAKTGDAGESGTYSHDEL